MAFGLGVGFGVRLGVGAGVAFVVSLGFSLGFGFAIGDGVGTGVGVGPAVLGEGGAVSTLVREWGRLAICADAALFGATGAGWLMDGAFGVEAATGAGATSGTAGDMANHATRTSAP